MDRMRRLYCCFNQFFRVGESGGSVFAIKFQFPAFAMHCSANLRQQSGVEIDMTFVKNMRQSRLGDNFEDCDTPLDFAKGRNGISLDVIFAIAMSGEHLVSLLWIKHNQRGAKRFSRIQGKFELAPNNVFQTAAGGEV